MTTGLECEGQLKVCVMGEESKEEGREMEIEGTSIWTAGPEAEF